MTRPSMKEEQSSDALVTDRADSRGYRPQSKSLFRVLSPWVLGCVAKHATDVTSGAKTHLPS